MSKQQSKGEGMLVCYRGVPDCHLAHNLSELLSLYCWHKTENPEISQVILLHVSLRRLCNKCLPAKTPTALDISQLQHVSGSSC